MTAQQPGDRPADPSYNLSGDFRGSTVNIQSTVIGGPVPGAPLERPRVFLSYSWNDDKPFVEQLQRDLEEAGFDVWRDETHLGSNGPDLPDEIREQIDRRERFVPIIGPGAFKSQAVRAEWDHARLKCKVFTPVWRLGDEPPPPDFQAKLYTDFREDRDGYAYQTKLDHLKRLLAEEPATPGVFLTRFPDLPSGVIQRKELEEVRRLLKPLGSGEAVLAITGMTATRVVEAPPGLGKSVLAAIFARECSTRWKFPDGLIWLTVGREAQPEALQRQLGALAGDAAVADYRDAADGAAKLQRLLGGQKLLIVLDDVWDHRHAAPLIVDAPGCRWLITTRRGRVADDLGLSDSQCISVGLLTVEEGLALIAGQMGRPASDEAEAAVLAAIVGELGFHTQAVAIAASRLKRGLNPARLLDRLRAALGGGSPFADLKLDDERRERNLEKSLEESYLDMEIAQRRRFRALGVFAPDGTFGLEAAAAVWDDLPSAAEDALLDLVDASLLTRAGERYSQHALLRAYAAALLRREGEVEAARERHFGYYAAEYGELEGNRAYANEGRHTAITVDFDNILHGIDWAFSAAPDLACDLLFALDNSYMEPHVPLAERSRLFGTARSKAEYAGYLRGVARMSEALGNVARSAADYPSAWQFYEDSRSIYACQSDVQGEANVTFLLGEVARLRSEPGLAARLFEEARSGYQLVGDLRGAANSVLGIGLLAFAKSDFEDAEVRSELAWTLYELAGDRIGEARAKHVRGDVFLKKGDLWSASGMYREALQILQQMGDRLEEANVIQALGHVARMQAEYETARRLYEEAQQIYAVIGDRLGEANVLMALGDVAYIQAEYESAWRLYEEAQLIYAAIDQRLGLSNVLFQLGQILWAQNQLSAAEPYLAEAVELNNQFAPGGWVTLYFTEQLAALRAELAASPPGSNV